MKISLERKILLGFVINLIVVAVLFGFFISRTQRLKEHGLTITSDWVEIGLFLLVFIFLFVVFFILRSQSKAKKIANQLIIDNRQLLLSIINNTSTPISIKKINGEYLLVNDQFKTLFDVEDEIIGKRDEDFLPKETADDYRHSDLEVVKAEKELKHEQKIVELDGIHTYLTVKFPLFDSNDRIYAVGSIGTDITDRKTTEKSLLDADTFFNLSLDIMVIASKDKFVKINSSLSRVLGYTTKELLDSPFTTFIHPDDIERTEKKIEKLQSGINITNFSNRWITKDEKTIWLSWIATADKKTGLLYALAHDITVNKKSREELKVVNKFFDMSYDIMGVAVHDHFVKINAAATRILGYTSEDIRNNSIESFLHPDDIKAFHDMLPRLKKGESLVSFRNRVRSKDGSYKTIEWTATSDAETGESFVVGRNVTNLLEKEDSLKLVNNFFEMSLNPFTVGKGSNIIKINPALTKVLGYTFDDVENSNESIIDYVHDDYKKIAAERMAKRSKGEMVESRFKYPLLCKDGSYKWMEVTVSSDIKSGLTYTILKDIHKQMENEESLKIADTFINLSSNFMVVLSDNKFLRVNPFMMAKLGYTKEELLEQLFTTFVFPEDVQSTLDEIKRIKDGSETTDFENRWVCKDKSVIWLCWTFALDADKKLVYGVAKEITEQLKLKKEEEKAVEDLHENEQRLRLIIDNIGDGVIVADSHKKILLSNFMADELFGTNGDGIRSASLSDKFDIHSPKDDSVFPSQKLAMAKALKGEPTDDIDVILKDRKTNETKRVLLSGRPLADQENNIVAAVVTIKDISKYKQLEEELKKRIIGFKKRGE